METISNTKEVKANKDHKCDFCGERIPSGSKYFTSTHKQEGHVYDWKSHPYCSKLASRLNMYEDADEGVSADIFQETISSYHDDALIDLFPKDEINKYSDIIQQIRHVSFHYKLMYVIRHYGKLDKKEVTNEQ